MSMFKVEITGMREVQQALAALPKRIRAEVQKATPEIGALVVATARQSLEEGAKRATGSPDKQASPDQALDIEAVARDIVFEPDADGLGGTVISRSEASAALEFGTTKTPARPFLFPALEANRKNIVKRYAEAVARALKR